MDTVSFRVRALASTLTVCAITLAAACGGSPLAAKPDPHAVVHSYAAEGFSIAYGPQWQSSQKSATSQTARQLLLTQQYSSSTGLGEVLVSISVQPEHLYRDPAVYQAKYEDMLKSMGGSPKSITLSGTPAVYWKGVSGYGVSLTAGGRSYVLMGTIPSGGDAGERPQVLAVFESFKLLAASASGPQTGASQTTVSPTATSPTVPSSPSSQPTAVSSQAQSAQYVDRVAPVVVAFSRQLSVAGKAQAAWNSQDTSTWPAFHKAVDLAVAQFAADEAKLKAISPPSSFKKAHAKLMRVISQARAGYAHMGAGLKSGQPAPEWVPDVATRLTVAKGTLFLFKDDFIAAASQTGVKIGFDLP